VSGYTFLHKGFAFLKKLTGENGNRSGTVTNLSILGSGNVNQNSGSRMDNIKELEDSGTIVRDGGLTLTTNNLKIQKKQEAVRIKKKFCYKENGRTNQNVGSKRS
jgi:hypothetical protein